MAIQDDLHELAKYVVKFGHSLGADQVEAYTIFGSAKSVQIERGSIRRFTDTSNSGLGIRVIKDKAIGMASTTIFTKDSLEKSVKDAYSLALVSPPDSNFKSLPTDTREAPTVPGRYDKAIEEIDVEEFTELILESIQEATIRDDAIVSGNFNAGIGERYIINSEGIDRFATQTSVSGYLGVKIQDGDDIGNAYYYDAATLLKNFKHIKIGKESGIRAKKMLGSQKIDTASLPILLDPDSTYGTIDPILSSGINAFSVFNKTAFFVDKIGDSIASNKLSIIDDPFVPEGTDSAGFDDEGIVPKKLTLVEDGILQTYITDSYTAPLVGLENTGHASRGSFASRPRPAPYTMQIKAGTVSKDELLEDMKEGIYLMSSSIHSRGDNPQVSAQINQGFYVKDGELLYPVKNAVIGCTIFELFNKIENMSKETESRSGHEAPWMLLSPLQVSGGK
jgi:PmbA protein